MFRFGPALVDTAARVVEVGGETRHLEPQAFDLLAYLLEHRDRVVPKEELLDEVWGDQFVSESALTTRIKEIRRALDDDGNRQQVVRNYRGRGYRFVADLDGAREAPPKGAGDHIDLLGRDDDLRAVDQHLVEARVVTLVGPGGVGKTTLARAAAHRVAGRMPGGVQVVSLAPVNDPRDIVHVLRRVTGLTDSTSEDELFAAVAGLDALVVVDNCEHVLDEAARVVAGIGATPGGTRVLATSRERLGIGQEQVHRLAPLDDATARDLLLTRANAAHPGYQWRPDEEEHVGRLLRMLDRLPLAIEMAAARLGTVGVADLVTVLTDRLDLLQAPNRAAEDRHRTMAALVSWSEDLLEPDARALLLDLSVFSGRVSAADIAAVVGHEEAELTLGPLADLVDHSLVVADANDHPGRYRMLETVRATVAPRRDPATDERHARHVADAVRAAAHVLRTPDEAAGAARIEELVEEIRVAHRWARRHDQPLASDLTASLLHHAQERQWSEPAIWSREAVASLEPEVDDAPFAAAIAADAASRGDFVVAKEMAGRALESSAIEVATSVHDTLGNIGIYSGDLETTPQHGQVLVELGERTGDSTAWTLGLAHLVLPALYGGDPAEARRLFDGARPPAPLSVTCEAWRAYAEGEILSVEGRVESAVARFDHAIAAGSSVGSGFVVSMARTSSLAVQARAGDIDAALADFATVLSHHRRTRSLTHAATALRNLIVLMVRARHDEFAMQLLGALSDPSVKTTYGSESELLDQARATVEARQRRDDVDAWLAAGAEHDAVWALDRAIDMLEELT